MVERLKIDTSFSCRMRTTQLTITATGTDPPQPVPATPMPGRKLLIILNNDNGEAPVTGNTRVVIGDERIFYNSSVNPPAEGYGLLKFESIALPVDDKTIVYAIQDVNDPNPGSADLRTIEVA
jgi:hypothetical protein